VPDNNGEKARFKIDGFKCGQQRQAGNDPRQRYWQQQ
jgi:hypothetical protein